jgi:nucleotide-binding universal stress UspA family protein
MMPFRHILAPTDFGESSLRAMRVAVDLANRLGAHLTVVHVYEIPSYSYAGSGFTAVDLLTPIEDAARKELERTLAEVRAKVPTATAVLRRGVAWVEVLNAVEEANADLVVMGTHGRRGLSRALLGSVAEKLVRSSPVPVLTVGPDKSPDAAATKNRAR